MRLQFDQHGNMLVDPRELATKLGTDAARLRHLKRLGLVSSRIEPGSGKDKGRSRVTVRTETAAWEAIFDEAGALILERKLRFQTRASREMETGFSHCLGGSDVNPR